MASYVAKVMGINCLGSSIPPTLTWSCFCNITNCCTLMLYRVCCNIQYFIQVFNVQFSQQQVCMNTDKVACLDITNTQIYNVNKIKSNAWTTRIYVIGQFDIIEVTCMPCIIYGSKISRNSNKNSPIHILTLSSSLISTIMASKYYNKLQ